MHYIPNTTKWTELYVVTWLVDEDRPIEKYYPVIGWEIDKKRKDGRLPLLPATLGSPDLSGGIYFTDDDGIMVFQGFSVRALTDYDHLNFISFNGENNSKEKLSELAFKCMQSIKKKRGIE